MPTSRTSFARWRRARAPTCSRDATDEDLLPAVRAVAAGKPFFSPAVTAVLVEDYVRTLQHARLDRLLSTC